ncbi:MAG: hypothetical protein ACP59X_09550 [Solidesulfovibrio sp. DCME]|uniref:hypothetical protein n=1 Tax=Solidesulfovibrio sp. DCME TaxID=3447380 RepID=UPI003D12B5F0
MATATRIFVFMAAALFLAAVSTLPPALAGDTTVLLAQQGPLGTPPQAGQGGKRQPQGGQQPAQPGTMQPQAQPGAMQQPAQPGGDANGCMQSYQRCVMMCAGVANCINNCNVGYAVCTQPQGGRPGGS